MIPGKRFSGVHRQRAALSSASSLRAAVYLCSQHNLSIGSSSQPFQETGGGVFPPAGKSTSWLHDAVLREHLAPGPFPSNNHGSLLPGSISEMFGSGMAITATYALITNSFLLLSSWQWRVRGCSLLSGCSYFTCCRRG